VRTGRAAGTDRFRPVRHFPSHSLQSTAAESACTDLPRVQGLTYPEFPGECRSGAHSATPSRQPAARRGATAHHGGASASPVRATPGAGPAPVGATSGDRPGRLRRTWAACPPLIRGRPGARNRRTPRATGPLRARAARRRLGFVFINTPTTCGSTMRHGAEGALRGPWGGRRTSQSAQRVKRFVIECFTPRCLVDLASDGELVTNAPPDTVDLIMGGLTGENMQDRGDDASIRGGLELHEPGVQFRYGGGQSVASTIGIASRHS
jgi:hypothetical protein